MILILLISTIIKFNKLELTHPEIIREQPYAPSIDVWKLEFYYMNYYMIILLLGIVKILMKFFKIHTIHFKLISQEFKIIQIYIYKVGIFI